LKNWVKCAAEGAGFLLVLVFLFTFCVFVWLLNQVQSQKCATRTCNPPFFFKWLFFLWI